MANILVIARLTLCLAFFCSAAIAQSEYIEKKEQATSLEIGMEKAGDGVGLAGAVSASLFSRADVGFQIERANVSSLTLWAFGPTADFYLLKNGVDAFPISLGVGGGFFNCSVSNGHSSEAVWEHEISAFTTRRLAISRAVCLIPRFGIGSVGLNSSTPESFKYVGLGLCARRGHSRLIVNLTVRWHQDSSTDVMISVGSLFFKGPDNSAAIPGDTPFSN
jgi:hypothetical protein